MRALFGCSPWIVCLIVRTSSDPIFYCAIMALYVFDSGVGFRDDGRVADLFQRPYRRAVAPPVSLPMVRATTMGATRRPVSTLVASAFS